MVICLLLAICTVFSIFAAVAAILSAVSVLLIVASFSLRCCNRHRTTINFTTISPLYMLHFTIDSDDVDRVKDEASSLNSSTAASSYICDSPSDRSRLRCTEDNDIFPSGSSGHSQPTSISPSIFTRHDPDRDSTSPTVISQSPQTPSQYTRAAAQQSGSLVEHESRRQVTTDSLEAGPRNINEAILRLQALRLGSDFYHDVDIIDVILGNMSELISIRLLLEDLSRSRTLKTAEGGRGSPHPPGYKTARTTRNLPRSELPRVRSVQRQRPLRSQISRQRRVRVQRQWLPWTQVQRNIPRESDRTYLYRPYSVEDSDRREARLRNNRRYERHGKDGRDGSRGPDFEDSFRDIEPSDGETTFTMSEYSLERFTANFNDNGRVLGIDELRPARLERFDNESLPLTEEQQGIFVGSSNHALPGLELATLHASALPSSSESPDHNRADYYARASTDTRAAQENWEASSEPAHQVSSESNSYNTDWASCLSSELNVLGTQAETSSQVQTTDARMYVPFPFV